MTKTNDNGKNETGKTIKVLNHINLKDDTIKTINNQLTMNVEGCRYVVKWENENWNIQDTVSIKVGSHIITADEITKKVEISDYIYEIMNGKKLLPLMESHVLERVNHLRSIRFKNWNKLHLKSFNIEKETHISQINNMFQKYVINEKGEKRKLTNVALRWDVQNGGIMLIPIINAIRRTVK